MTTKAVCPGSFDPITLGHVDIINRASAMFDEVTVLVTANPDKPSGLFSVEERVDFIRETFDSHIKVDWWSGLLVDYTTEHGIDTLVKGLRSSLDYEYELPMAQMNHAAFWDRYDFSANRREVRLHQLLVVQTGGEVWR